MAVLLSVRCHSECRKKFFLEILNLKLRVYTNVSLVYIVSRLNFEFGFDMEVKKYTKQEAFDIVAEHLHKQGVRSVTLGHPQAGSDGDKCQYRKELEDGTILKCAIGALMSEEDNIFVGQSTSNGYDVPTILGRFPARFFEISGIPLPFVRALQRIHDIKANWTLNDMNSRLESIATYYNLEYVPRTSDNSNIGKI